MSSVLGRIGGIPPVFSEECARDLFLAGCERRIFESVEAIEEEGVAERRICVGFRMSSGVTEDDKLKVNGCQGVFTLQ